MGRKPVYKRDTTSIQVSQFVSILLGRKKRSNETKSDVIERLLVAQTDPNVVDSLRQELQERIIKVQQKKLDVAQQERHIRQNTLEHPVTVEDNTVYDTNKTYSNVEICGYICERLGQPKTGILMLSAEVKHLKTFIQRGEIIQLSKNSYRIAPITEN